MTYVWGVDPAISHVSFAFADMSSDQIDVESLITACDEREGKRLGWLDRQVRIYARLAAGVYPPDVIWVEQPSGRGRNLQLCYAVGVIQAALFETLAVPVWTIPSSTWKQRTVGSGNASKAQVRFWVENTLRMDVNSQDDADAVAIAAAGRAMFAAGKWEAAA